MSGGYTRTPVKRGRGEGKGRRRRGKGGEAPSHIPGYATE